MNDPINDDNFNFTEQREAQLTAYALGELDEHERALVERRLEHDAEARAIVAQVRELATTLTAELAAEPMPRLSEPQREALQAEHPTRVNGVMKGRTVPLRTRLWFGAGLAAAACLAIAVTTFNFGDSVNEPRTREANRLALGLPADEVQGRVDGRGQSVGKSGSGELYAFGKQDNNESTGFKRQAGRELTLDAADKLAAAETAAGVSPMPGASTTEMYRAPMQTTPQPVDAEVKSPAMPAASPAQLGQELATRKSEERVVRQPLDQLAGGQAPAPTAAPVPASPPPPSAPTGSAGSGSGHVHDSLGVPTTGRRIAASARPGSTTVDANGEAGATPWSQGANGSQVVPADPAQPSESSSRVLYDTDGDAGDKQLHDLAVPATDYPLARARLEDLSRELSTFIQERGINGLDDPRFSQTSVSVTDLAERIAGAKQDLAVIQSALVQTAQKLEGTAPPSPEDVLAAQQDAAVRRFDSDILAVTSEVSRLREKSAAGDPVVIELERRLQAMCETRNRQVDQVVTHNQTKRLKELDDTRNKIRQFISELEVERDRCEALRRQQPNTETYNRIVDNPFLAVTENPLSTFSIDVDTGSYANVRRFLLQNNTLPPPDAVRIEELINYFPLTAAAPAPESEHPFAVHVDMWEAPWSGDHHLARVTIKGREVKMDQRPATSLVFLIDVSGSMQPANKLPLLKQSMKMLVDQLHGDDRIAIVTYAGASGLVLPSTFASDKQRILGAIDNLNAGGSTNGAAGIQLAYQVAAESYIPGGVNRVILATDGDFNVGVSDDASLIRLIEEKRGTGVHLSVLGFGEGNLKDAKMEQLANHGNGEYAYIDSAREGRKVLVEQAVGTLITIAKDVKIQIEFNPATVASYRLIGYENRVLAKEDFNNDAKDAGEIGAGHCVTALYEIVSANADVAGVAPIDALKYQKPVVQPTDAAKNSGELMTIKLRYKQPDGQVSKLIEMPVPDMRGRLGWVPDDMRFLTAVAEFGMLLRNSPYKGNASFAQVLDLAEGARGEDVRGYRAEFIELVNRARALRGQ